MLIEYSGVINTPLKPFKRWALVDESERKDIEQQIRLACNNTDVYCSIRKYTDMTFKNSVSGFYADFDCETNIDQAQKDAIIFCEIMHSTGVPYEMMKISFTGCKGFAVVVPCECINAQPSEDNYEIVRFAMIQLKKNGKLNTMDSAVYDSRRPWRLENSINSKTGLYKIPLNFNELKTLSITEIKELAKQPRKVECIKPTFIKKLNEAFLHAKTKYELGKIKKRDYVTQDKITGKFSPCIKAIMKGVEENMRNNCTYVLATYFKKRGMDYDQVVNKLISINENNKPPLSEMEVKQTISSVFNKDISVGCTGEGLISQVLREFCDEKHCRFKSPQRKVWRERKILWRTLNG